MKLPLWIWILCLLGLPLIMVHALIDAITLPRMLLLFFAEIAILGLFLFRKNKDFHSHTTVFLSSFLGISLVTYLLFAGLSLSQTLSFSDGLVEWLKIFSWLIIMLLSSFFFKEQEQKIILLKVSMLAALLVSLLGVAEYLVIINKLDQDKILYTVNSTFEHKNLLATGLLLSIPFSLISFMLAKEKFWKGLSLLTTVLIFFLILVTQSRAAWLGLVGSLIVGLLLLLSSPNKRQKILNPKWIISITTVFCIAISGIWLFSSQNDVANSPIKRVQAIFTYEDTKNEHTETIKERFVLWNNSIAMLKEYPVLGVGLGQWKIHFPKYNIKNLRSEQGQIFFQRPHNDYLWVFSEMGILGGLSYLSLLLGILYAAFKVLRHHDLEKNATYWLILLTTLGLLTFIIFSIVDFPKERPVHLLWSGLLMALIWQEYQKIALVKPKFNNSSGVLYIFLAIAVFGAFFVIMRIRSEAACKQALHARSQKQSFVTLQYLNQANNWTYRLDPASTPLSWYIGEAHFLMNEPQKALEAFEAAKQLHPYHIHTLNNLGATYFALNNLEEAKNYFQQVLDWAPHFPDANMNMAAISYNQGQIKEAVGYIGACVPMNYQDTRFIQFLDAITKAYVTKLKQNENLKKLSSPLDDLSQSKEWQQTIHKSAQKYNRILAEQIHLDLLYVAKEKKYIQASEKDALLQILNKL